MKRPQKRKTTTKIGPGRTPKQGTFETDVKLSKHTSHLRGRYLRLWRQSPRMVDYDGTSVMTLIYQPGLCHQLANDGEFRRTSVKTLNWGIRNVQYALSLESLTFSFHVFACYRGIRRTLRHPVFSAFFLFRRARTHPSVTTLNYTDQIFMDAFQPRTRRYVQQTPRKN